MIETTQLYDLLPDRFRAKDLAQGEPLKAFVAVLQSQYDALAANVDQLYANAFIETCASWAVPYIAGLVGADGLENRYANVATQRARVADLAWQRTFKGTSAVLARAAGSASGWPMIAEEGIDQVAFTQPLGDLRPARGETVNVAVLGAVSFAAELAWNRLPVPLAGLARNVRLNANRAAPVLNSQSLSLRAWRLRPYPLERVDAASVVNGDYRLHPADIDCPVYQLPASSPDPVTPLDAGELPIAITRQDLAGRLRCVRDGVVGVPIPFRLRAVAASGESAVIAAAWLRAANLQDWSNPQVLDAPPDWGRSGADKDVVALVDPQLGRVRLLSTQLIEQAHGFTPTGLQSDHVYAFSGPIGGGPYSKGELLAALQAGGARFEALVMRNPPADASGTANLFGDMESALAAWKASNRNGLIRILDNASYVLSGSGPQATGLSLDLSSNGLVIMADPGFRPCLKFGLAVTGGNEQHSLVIDGVLMLGGLQVSGNLRVNLVDSCLRPSAQAAGLSGHALGAQPGPASPVAVQRGAALPDVSSTMPITLIIERSLIFGALQLFAAGDRIHVKRSVLDNGSGASIATQPAIGATQDAVNDQGMAPDVSLDEVTVIGDIHAGSLTRARNLLCSGAVRVQDRSIGRVSHSYIVQPSRLPKTPSLAVAVGEQADLPVPSFTTLAFGQPGYAQLTDSNSPLILAGGSQNEAVGAFHFLRDAQRRKNIQPVLDSFLAVGRAADLVFEN